MKRTTVFMARRAIPLLLFLVLAGGVGGYELSEKISESKPAQSFSAGNIKADNSPLVNASTANITYTGDSPELKKQLADVTQRLVETRRRRISPEQASKLTSLAQQTCPFQSGLVVLRVGFDSESSAYAQDFIDVFTKAGCTPKGDSDMLSPNVIGLVIGVRDEKTPPPGAIALQKILTTAGFNPELGTIDDTMQTKAPFFLGIGSHP